MNSKTSKTSINTNGLVEFSNSRNDSTLFELYTSEGCSSCPPAEKYFNRMRDDARLFKSVFPVVFHVDYWDYIGWKDPLAHSSFTKRQRAITTRQKKKTIYTPGVYRQSKIWQGWRKAYQSPAELKKGSAGLLTVSMKELESAFIRYESNEKEVTFHWAILTMEARTSIARGERSGEKAKHHFSVIGYGEKIARKEKSKNAGKALFKMELPVKSLIKGYPIDAMVVWVTAKDSDTPLQVAGAYLRKE